MVLCTCQKPSHNEKRLIACFLIITLKAIYLHSISFYPVYQSFSSGTLPETLLPPRHRLLT
jgi:hypothetical protein